MSDCCFWNFCLASWVGSNLLFRSKLETCLLFIVKLVDLVIIALVLAFVTFRRYASASASVNLVLRQC
jgi:hypothetical protein